MKVLGTTLHNTYGSLGLVLGNLDLSSPHNIASEIPVKQKNVALVAKYIQEMNLSHLTESENRYHYSRINSYTMESNWDHMLWFSDAQIAK